MKGLVLGLNEEFKQEALLELLISEAIKTSEIEGEYMSRDDVMSSIKNNLGLQKYIPVKDQRVSGMAKLMTEIVYSRGFGKIGEVSVGVIAFHLLFAIKAH